MTEKSKDCNKELDNNNNNNYVLSEKTVNDQQNSEIKSKDVVEIGGPKGPEPTRYGDWEKKGRCIDF